MTDKLAQIEAKLPNVFGFVSVKTDDRDALVEIARAAQELGVPAPNEPGPYVLVRLDELRDLAAAVDRLKENE